MTEEEENFIKKNFKEGEYSVLTIMVTNEQILQLVDTLKDANLNLVILPSTKTKIDFETEEI